MPLLGTEEAQPSTVTIPAGQGEGGQATGPAEESTLEELRCHWLAEAPATGHLALCADAEGKPGTVLAEWPWTIEGEQLVAKGSVTIPGGSKTFWLVVQPIGGGARIKTKGKSGAAPLVSKSSNEAATVGELTWGATQLNGPLWMWGLGKEGTGETTPITASIQASSDLSSEAQAIGAPTATLQSTSTTEARASASADPSSAILASTQLDSTARASASARVTLTAASQLDARPQAPGHPTASLDASTALSTTAQGSADPSAQITAVSSVEARSIASGQIRASIEAASQWSAYIREALSNAIYAIVTATSSLTTQSQAKGSPTAKLQTEAQLQVTAQASGAVGAAVGTQSSLSALATARGIVRGAIAAVSEWVVRLATPASSSAYLRITDRPIADVKVRDRAIARIAITDRPAALIRITRR